MGATVGHPHGCQGAANRDAAPERIVPCRTRSMIHSRKSIHRALLSGNGLESFGLCLGYRFNGNRIQDSKRS